MATETQIADAFRIIAEAVSVEPEELQDLESWTYLGLTGLLATATVSDLKQQAGIDLPADVFSVYRTVADLKNFLHGSKISKEETFDTGEPEDPWEGIPKPKVPISVVLQGSVSTADKIVFLFPDGSGAGTSYGTLPRIGEDICLVGLNSPFLRQAENFTCSIERMARLWIGEVRKVQPAGKPYFLGGWSAGGYYSYEVAKLLSQAGAKVARLILIDSPCRLRYEALPEQVVAELTRKGLMGASGQKKAPEWLVQHFTSTVISVDQYHPTALVDQHVPAKVDFIWVREGLVDSVAASGLDVDLDVKVTRFLLEPRSDLKTEGWEDLLPGAEFSFHYMTGNHFEITQPPHSQILGEILTALLGR
ncbi:Putative thioesterase, phosphopantetheine binding ACP domain, alpha/Beta hydrolase [Septoria linicola]|uniref:Thioesterase, phosphopantetheine binding ACP domain, alpha/Beta hydrolase n=1 Tax=Septoria linicola TaxID=215465 RepID=A0A9Q9B484_9PEZI|nr:putative thioesterase, phosphopantetheine binding ACP domain, alpha/Beta hydrolase [Septoria linicola]USW56916.1 Putative thioesterase, phosphopantetheine binding ACP domain, alpha/Beta hydrolase [Septoria linicola]